MKEYDCILCGHVSGGKLKELLWLFADRVISVPSSDPAYKPGFPYEVVQIHDLKHYPPPPFLADQKLCAAMGRVLKGSIQEEPESPNLSELVLGEMQNIFENFE